MNEGKLTIEMLKAAYAKLFEDKRNERIFEVSPSAYDMAIRIIKLRPDLILTGESSIWFYAHKLGLTKE